MKVDPKIVQDAVKVITNTCMHKGTKLTDDELAKLKTFGDSIKKKTITLDDCKEVFSICKTARIRSKKTKKR